MVLDASQPHVVDNLFDQFVDIVVEMFVVQRCSQMCAEDGHFRSDVMGVFEAWSLSVLGQCEL